MVAFADTYKPDAPSGALSFVHGVAVAVEDDGAVADELLSASAVCSGEQGRATFTGYVADQETGLYYARGRMYSSTLGRFVSRDPIMARSWKFADYTKSKRNPKMWGPSGLDGYQDGYSLYMAYFVPNGLDPSGLGNVTVTLTNGTVWNSGENPNMDDVRNYLDSLPEGSVESIEFKGHGANTVMQVNDDDEEGLVYDPSTGGVTWSDTGKDASELFRKIMKKAGEIDLNGCHTAREGSWLRRCFFDPSTNIASGLSGLVPGVNVTGNEGFAVGTGTIGNLLGMNTRVFIRRWHTYCNGGR